MKALKENLETLNKILYQIRITDVMSKPVTVVNVKEDFSRVEEIFIQKGMRHLPVVNDKNQIVGIISQRDVYRSIAPRRAPGGKMVYQKDVLVDGDGYYKKESLNQYIIQHVMHKNPEVLSKYKTLGDAIFLLEKHKSGCVPIIDHNKQVVGILTRFDIIKLANAGFEIK